MATILGLVLVGLLAFNVSPRPGAFVIRYVFENGAADTKKAMEKHAPDGITVLSDIQYRDGDDDAYLDVYVAETAAASGAVQPIVVWTHGGAWISGHKDDAAPYFKLIAAQGYTVVSLDYSLGPDRKYPTAIHQVNDALAFIRAHATEYHADPERIVMAGDSAGAQITSQIATIVTNPEFAAEMGITPSLTPQQLRGVVLFCGIYDLDLFMENANLDTGLLGWGSRTTIWAYTGTKDGNATDLQQMSSIDHVTASFPPAFISGGNGDPLTKDHSIPLADRLGGLGVTTDTLFYSDDHEPTLEHEYQFDLDNADGQTAFSRMMAFIDQVTGTTRPAG